MQRATLLCFLLVLFTPVLFAQEAVKRILIVGDSWAASITAENHDGFPAPDVFDEVLAENGLGRFQTQGQATAWGGRKASDWAKPEHLATIKAELEKYPSIDIVHLIIGGNDFLSQAMKGSLAGKSREERQLVWDPIIASIRAIVEFCLAVRPDIRVVIADYDYLDFELARQAWKMDFGTATTAELNTWLKELGDQKKKLAEDTDRCEYVDNWGTLQYWFVEPPKSVARHGDPAKGMPAGVSPDGIHPTAEAHKRLLQNAVDAHYRKWLGTPEGGVASDSQAKPVASRGG
ncbi:MAG: SGNH/GDSL hydrolase family protein [Candidatus Hydrogenedentes bacterium]|nr:SGNH/GDSL hydrolase family protein [Candidatus Hydrogenedentota bacterium]